MTRRPCSIALAFMLLTMAVASAQTTHVNNLQADGNINANGNVTAANLPAGTINTGTGTTNTLPKYTNGASGVLGNSSVTDNGTTVSTSEVFSAASYSNNLGAFASTTSAQLLGVISDETGTGALVFANTPTLVTPNIGAATGTSVSLTGVGTFAGVVSANGGLNVSKVIRDCRTDGVVCNATWNGTTLTGTDDSAAITACLVNAYAAGQGGVQLPSGKCRVNTTINDTNKTNLDVYGSNSNEEFSTTLAGQDFGLTGTQLLGNTGSTPVWDATGSGRSRLKNFSIRVPSGLPTPSEIGFLFGRDNAVSNGSSTGVGTFCFSEENKLENVWVYMDTRPAATAVGTVPVYNVGAEQFQIIGGGYIGDLPLFISATNDLSLASPYQTLLTGCPTSMSEVKIGHGVVLQAWTKQAMDLRGIIDFESEKDTEILNGVIGTNHSSAVVINSGSNVPTNITLQGQDEGFDFPLTLNTTVEAMDARMTAVAPTAAGLIVVGNGITVSDSYFNMPQINGTLQPLFNVLSGTATIRGSILYEGKNSGSGTGANNLTLTGSTIYAPGLTDTAVNTFAAASNYAVYDATGMSTVGNYRVTNLGVGAGAVAGTGILENNSNLTGAFQIGIQSAPVTSSTSTSEGSGIYARADTAAAAFTQALNTGLHVNTPTVGAGSTITEWDGIRIEAGPTAGTKFAIKTIGTETSQFGGQIQSTVTTGTAPFIVASTTAVPNLKVQNCDTCAITTDMLVTETTAPSGAAGKEVCYGDSTAHTLKCSYNNGTFGNSVLSAVGNSATSDVSERRYKANQGTAFSGADAAIVLSAGWGTGPAVSAATGFDQAFSFSVTAGTTPGANPTITVTFKDGTWTAAPQCIISRNDITTPFNTPPHTWTTSATQLVVTVNGTPTAANVYKYVVMCMGN